MNSIMFESQGSDGIGLDIWWVNSEPNLEWFWDIGKNAKRSEEFGLIELQLTYICVDTRLTFASL